jgi:hypothetical protein
MELSCIMPIMSDPTGKTTTLRLLESTLTFFINSYMKQTKARYKINVIVRKLPKRRVR